MKGELFSGEVFLKPHIACPDKGIHRCSAQYVNLDLSWIDDDDDVDDVDDDDDDVDDVDVDDLACPSMPSILEMRAAFSPIDLGDEINRRSRK